MTKRLALLQKLAQRSIARIPQSTKYGNLRFIKNLGGLPTVENGLTWLSPKTQYFANLTTDVPFRLHHSYPHIPGGEYMVINPDAFKGVKPFTINPMDTILKNSEALVDPKYITIVSGNPGLLRQAKQQGFNIAITPELHTGYQRVLGEINAPTNPFDRKLHKSLSFGQSGYAKQYRQAADDFFTRLGRPTHQDYLRLEQATGLPSYTIPFSQMQHNFNAGKAGVTWGNMSKPAFTYPDGREIIGTKILTKELDDFYKHVGYNPIPETEWDLLNQMGGFSKQHPTIFDIYPDTEKIFEQWRMLNVPGSLKNGGKIAKYQGAGWIGKGIKWLTTKGDDIVKSSKNLGINLGILGADGKLFHATIPQQSENFYRVVGWDAIADAKKSRVIRGNPYKPQHGPYFQYNANPQSGVKRLPVNNPYIHGRYVIEGFPNSATNWIDSWRAVSRRPHIIKQYESSKLGFFDESETAFWKELYETPIKDIRLPVIENPVAIPYLENKGKRLLEFGNEAFPMTNGIFEAPAKNFFYYKHYPLFGWRRFKFKFGGSVK